ncbi:MULTISPECIES: hypothetical protein [unclassified Streptomyces]|uniref:phage tail tube protein n=1 Tax=unclassified Streptomyces TaxID=2593676 RepID=UPI002DDB8274|nr:MULTISPECIES: hypothetical protein [unclassified Streptomyces]WSC51566.1 hypothetical protein OG808_04160 [Streptomyces sp. NBC_01761]WSF82416.1 hypothetical protein OIE70_04300 [Streptomyces sp. NBC_01744]
MGTTQQRFMRRGITKIYFLPEIAAATNVPTRQEITSGTELSGAISDIAGWSLGSSPIRLLGPGTVQDDLDEVDALKAGHEVG